MINRRVDREVAAGDLQAALVARDGTWITKGVIENFLGDVAGLRDDRDDSLELLVLGTDPRGDGARRARGSPKWAAASRSTAAGRRRWRSTA